MDGGPSQGLGAAAPLISCAFIIWQVVEPRLSTGVQRPAGTSWPSVGKINRMNARRSDLNNKSKVREVSVCCLTFLFGSLSPSPVSGRAPCFLSGTTTHLFQKICTSWHSQMYFHGVETPLLSNSVFGCVPLTDGLSAKSNSDGEIPPKCHFQKQRAERWSLIVSDAPRCPPATTGT